VAPEEKRYFFDLNNFDQPEEPEPDPDLPPPPPMFSLEELGQARDEAFAAGRESGLEEARVSREQYVAEQIARINGDLKGLFLAEQMRENLFEKEVLALCSALFRKAFPAMNAIQGIEEVKAVLLAVLSHQERSQIVIEVPENDVEAIQSMTASLTNVEPESLVIKVGADLGAGSCRLFWQDGGAVRNHEALASALADQIEALLASAAKKNNNDESSKTDTEDKGE
jgi:flagellar assembly protein FliH